MPIELSVIKTARQADGYLPDLTASPPTAGVSSFQWFAGRGVECLVYLCCMQQHILRVNACDFCRRRRSTCEPWRRL